MKRRIVFRCSTCWSAAWVTASWRASKPAQVSCAKCGATYELAPNKGRGNSDHGYFQYAKAFATKNGIDLPTAYSVLENILTLERARSLPDHARDAPQSTYRVWHLITLGAGVVGIAALAAGIAIEMVRPTEVSRFPVDRAEVLPPAVEESSKPRVVGDPAPVPDVEVKTDPAGNLAEIAGPDPKRTFVAFCEHPSFAGRLSPVAIAQAVPPHVGIRIGIVRDHADLTVQRSVKIRRDERSHRWVIGDGSSPITLERAPELPPGAETPL